MMESDKPAVSRRLALGSGLAALGGGLALSACAATPAATPTTAPTAGGSTAPDVARYKDPVWNREQSARLEAHLNGGRQIYGRATGSVNGVRPGEAVRHLLNFEVFSTTRVVRRTDGQWDRMSKEVVFYLDPKTGRILDEWDNPYSGERVRVVDIANDPYNWVIRDWQGPPALPGADLHNLPEPPPEQKRPFLLHWTDFNEDTVVIEEGGHAYYPNKLDPAKWPRESAGVRVQASELFRYFIRRQDLEDASQDHLKHNGVWIRITPWLPWMLMGQAPGHCLYNGMFTKSDSLDRFNPAVLARVRERYAGYLSAPTSWYGPSLSSLEHYALEQKPAPLTKAP
jgi:hypothetical protein